MPPEPIARRKSGLDLNGTARCQARPAVDRALARENWQYPTALNQSPATPVRSRIVPARVLATALARVLAPGQSESLVPLVPSDLLAQYPLLDLLARSPPLDLLVPVPR